MGAKFMLEPGEFLGQAGVFVSAGAELADALAQLENAVAGEGPCWGDDAPGREFEKTYHPDAKQTVANLKNLVESLRHSASTMGKVVDDFNNIDIDAHKRVTNSGRELEPTASPAADRPAGTPHGQSPGPSVPLSSPATAAPQSTPTASQDVAATQDDVATQNGGARDGESLNRTELSAEPNTGTGGSEIAGTPTQSGPASAAPAPGTNAGTPTPSASLPSTTGPGATSPAATTGGHRAAEPSAPPRRVSVSPNRTPLSPGAAPSGRPTVGMDRTGPRGSTVAPPDRPASRTSERPAGTPGAQPPRSPVMGARPPGSKRKQPEKTKVPTEAASADPAEPTSKAQQQILDEPGWQTPPVREEGSTTPWSNMSRTPGATRDALRGNSRWKNPAWKT